MTLETKEYCVRSSHALTSSPTSPKADQFVEVSSLKNGSSLLSSPEMRILIATAVTSLNSSCESMRSTVPSYFSSILSLMSSSSGSIVSTAYSHVLMTLHTVTSSPAGTL